MRPLRLLALLALTFGTSSLGAQLVRGRALAAADSAPVSGVVVQLTTPARAVVAQTLSDSRGGFTLRAPSGGEFRLRALRLGFRPTLGAPFAVADSGVTLRSVLLDGAAVTLAATRVMADERCAADSDPSSLGFRAWGQARTALAAALVTRRSSTYEMRFVVGELRRAARSDSVIAYTEKESATSAMRPFAAMSVERLRDSGYVTREDGGVVTYAAPDEEVLLSEEFAASHCIRARSSSGDELELTFEPTRDRTLSDVAGSLVLSRSTSELRRLAYEYMNVSEEERAAHAGGELTFLRFPTGGWMVQRWLVRAPQLQVRERRATGGAYVAGGLSGGAYLGGGVARTERKFVLVSRQESRGEVLRVQQNGVLVWAAPTVSLAGIVIDDSLGTPVPGADVRIAGRASGAISDEHGRFRLDSARIGDILLQVSAPYAIQLGVPPTKVHLVLDAAPADVTLRVGNADQAIVDACLSANQPLSELSPRTIVRGIVRDAHGGRAGVSDVSATWMHGMHAALEPRERRSHSTAFGDYVVCGVEMNKEVTVRALLGGQVVASAKTVIEPGKPWATLDLLPPMP